MIFYPLLQYGFIGGAAMKEKNKKRRIVPFPNPNRKTCINPLGEIHRELIREEEKELRKTQPIDSKESSPQP